MPHPWIVFLEDETHVEVSTATLVMWVKDPESWLKLLGAALNPAPSYTAMLVEPGDREPETIHVIHNSHLQDDSSYEHPLGLSQEALPL